MPLRYQLPIQFVMSDPILAKVRKIPYEACILHHNVTEDHGIDDSDDDGFCLMGRSSIFVSKPFYSAPNYYLKLDFRFYHFSSSIGPLNYNFCI